MVRVMFAVRLKPDTDLRIRALAIKKGMTASALVRLWLGERLVEEERKQALVEKRDQEFAERQNKLAGGAGRNTEGES